MSRGVVLAGIVAGVCMAGSAFAVTAKRDGSPLPEAYWRARGKDASAFTMQHAWVQKTRELRAQRELFLAQHRGQAPLAAIPSSLAVTGTVRVPVLPGKYSDIATPPVSLASLQNQLFVSNATGTVSQYYTEASYGQLAVTGDVIGSGTDWTPLAHPGSYYEDISNGLTPPAKTGEFIKEILDIRDVALDFGLYDNDGPDGLANSGDDDGIVDAVVFVHGETGGECGGPNIISHSYYYSAWPTSGGFSYTTNDARTGGGFIQVDDYVMAPALNCGAVAPYTSDETIDIGVFCHELGHMFGLPDLYDRDGGTNGIGDWGIMGAGEWNTPERPAHFDPWCRMELGWVSPIDIGWQATTVAIPNVEQNQVVYRLPFTDERFRRLAACAINGSYSMYCGLTAAEGTTRGWASPGAGGGYGSNWRQTLEHDFFYSGSGSVSFQYDYHYDLELGYDFAYARIEVNGAEYTLATYTGSGAGTETIDLTPHLAPLAGAGGTYTLKFRATSDYSFDDSDGQDPSDCGMLAVDDVSVNGGGVAYATDFELRADGWYQDPAENPSSEYWLVENRRKLGFDQNLHGEGLLIWHVDDEVLHAPLAVNDGAGGNVRGLVLEEADGFDMSGLNYGEAEDAYPGPLNHTSFTSLTTPNSNDNTGRGTRIEVTNIGPSGSTQSATLRAGDPAPTGSAVDPLSIDNDQVATVVEVGGTGIRHGATILLSFSGGAASAPGDNTDGEDVVATSLEWVDPTLIRGTVNVYSKTPGLWDVIVTNPDGQWFSLPGAVTIKYVVATQLVSASVDVVGDGVRLRYQLIGREPGEVLRLYRSERQNGGWTVIAEDLQPVNAESYQFVDDDVAAGATYYYLLESRLETGEVRELHRGVAVVPARELVLEQNHPNPFNPTTSIRLYLPARTEIELDVYDVTGALVRRLASGTFASGSHVVDWDGTDASGRPVASGMYIYRVVADHHSISRKMMLLK
jgi:M6 family metalloprotease-like protein